MKYKYAMGWLPDYPDLRDYTPEHPDVGPMLQSIGALGEASGLPPAVDLRPYFSPVEDQGRLGSCTANAAVGLVEYYERRAFGKYGNASRLFLYKVTRNLLGLTGDTGAYIRTTMGALVLFGVPPEQYWPYVIKDFDKEPPAFCYALAQQYQAITYFRLDDPSRTLPEVLAQVKQLLATGIPSMFGFTVYSTIDQAETGGRIPLPSPKDSVLGGHAVVAAGYDDNLLVVNKDTGAETVGAFLIRNSWGTDWGEQGYGWLPYEYLLKGLAIDWWALVKSEWIDTGRFGF